MKAILRRLERVEQFLAPRPTQEDLREAEIVAELRERRRRWLEAQGLPFEESPPLPAEYQGRQLDVVETLRACRDQRLRLQPRLPENTE